MSEPTFPLRQLGTITAHTRPIEALAWDNTLSQLHTGDSMGVIKIWRLDTDLSEGACRPRMVGELKGHRTGVNEMWASDGKIWSGRYTVNTVGFARLSH